MKKTLIFLILISAGAIYAQTDDNETLKNLNKEVSAAYQNGKYDDALKFSRQILDLNIKIHGADHKDTAVAYTNLGLILRDKRKFGDSIESLENAVKIYEKAPVKNKESIARVLDILAGVQFLSGKQKDAEKSGLESLRLREEAFGKESREAYLSNVSLAEFYGRSNNKKKADEYYLNAYTLAIKKFGKKSSELDKLDDSRICSTAMIIESSEDFEKARQQIYGYARNNDILNGKAINLTRPPYPREAKAARASGAVVVKVLIDERGIPTEANPICGHPLLQKSTIEAAMSSRFTPTLKDGDPIKVRGYIVYRYVP